MERIPEILQFPVVIKWRRPLPVKFQPSQKTGFLVRDVSAQVSVPEELLEGWLYGALGELTFRKLKSSVALRREPAIETYLQCKRPQIDIPELDHRSQERRATFHGNAEHVRIQKFEDRDTHLLITPVTEFSHRTEPVFIAQLVPR